MTSQMTRNVTSNLGLFLVFGLLAGTFFDNPALGVLGGLLCHLMICSLYDRNHVGQADE